MTVRSGTYAAYVICGCICSVCHVPRLLRNTPKWCCRSHTSTHIRADECASAHFNTRMYLRQFQYLNCNDITTSTFHTHQHTPVQSYISTSTHACISVYMSARSSNCNAHICDGSIALPHCDGLIDLNTWCGHHWLSHIVLTSLAFTHCDPLIGPYVWRNVKFCKIP